MNRTEYFWLTPTKPIKIKPIYNNTLSILEHPCDNCDLLTLKGRNSTRGCKTINQCSSRKVHFKLI